MADPVSRADLLATKGFHGRGAQRYAERWVEALARARALPEDQLPVRAPRTDGPPAPRAWAERDPVAAERLVLARDGMARLSEEHQVPAENLLSPDTVRRVMWEPAGTDADAIEAQLRELGAREWQIGLTTQMLVDAVTAAQPARLTGARAGSECRPEDCGTTRGRCAWSGAPPATGRPRAASSISGSTASSSSSQSATSGG